MRPALFQLPLKNVLKSALPPFHPSGHILGHDFFNYYSAPLIGTVGYHFASLHTYLHMCEDGVYIYDGPS